MNPRKSGEGFKCIALSSVVVFGFVSALYAGQTASTAAPAPQGQSGGAEISTQESQPPFEIRVQHNEVMLRVVVRDAKGQAVTTLRQEDFRIFDRGKLQTITHFALERTGARASGVAATAAAGTGTPAGGASAAPGIVLPTRYVGMFFDDVHLQFGDLARTRDAAGKYLNSYLGPADRAGIFTSSGQNQLPFTDDRAKLHDALLKVVPRSIAGAARACPTLTGYEAYSIAELNDPTAMSVAQDDALYECCGGQQPCSQQSADYIGNLARTIFSAEEFESQYVFQGLEHLCRVMGTVVGQRSIVLVSPGFLAATQMFQLELVDCRGVTISMHHASEYACHSLLIL